MRLHAVYKYKGILLVERPMHTNAAQERGNSPRELNQIVFCLQKNTHWSETVIDHKCISLFHLFCGISMDGVLKWVHSGPLPDASPQIKPGSIRMPPPYSRFQFGQIHFAAWTNTLCNLDKYLLPMPATLHQIKPGSINMPQYFLFLTNSPPLGFILSNLCVTIDNFCVMKQWFASF